jgi:hypothetical protein
MTTMHAYPGGLSEMEFLDTYQRSVLRKPQVVADALLKTILHADARDRALLTAAIAVELAESCRRLCAVYMALNDRRYAISRSLLKPLPGIDDWRTFAQAAASMNPEQMVWNLSLPDSALDHAKRLRAQPDLGELSDLVAAAAGSAGMAMVPARGNEAWFGGLDEAGEPIAASLPVSETDAAGLADITADVSEIARGFLAAYLGARASAGRRE